VTHTLDSICEQVCESPIERSLLRSLIEAANERELCCACGDEASWTCTVGSGVASNIELEITPQARFGPYRVDFYLWLRSDGETLGAPSLIVECDGHDFHDRTKRQASRDRARDRALLARCATVFRFTGADIYHDALGCAHECLDFLTDALAA
jgi:very-short-patch-repair endonuclease